MQNAAKRLDMKLVSIKGLLTQVAEHQAQTYMIKHSSVETILLEN